MLYKTGVVAAHTPVAALVHDCQVVDVDLTTSPFDTLCDYVVTPSRVVEVRGVTKPTQGVLWDRLEAGMIDSIPPLRELREMERRDQAK
jgi:5-formyltetrahydrofolate cyclo-ligase